MAYNITDDDKNPFVIKSNPDGTPVGEGSTEQQKSNMDYLREDLAKQEEDIKKKYVERMNLADEYAAKAGAPSAVDTSHKGENLRRFIDNYKPREITEEERKKERTKRKIAALADGLIALSNFAGAAYGATPLQQKVTLTEAQKKRFDVSRKAMDGISDKERYQMYLSSKALDDSEDRRIKEEIAAESRVKKMWGDMSLKERKEAQSMLDDFFEQKAKALREQGKTDAQIQAMRDKTINEINKLKETVRNNKRKTEVSVENNKRNNATSTANNIRNNNQSNTNNIRNNSNKGSKTDTKKTPDIGDF